MYGVFLWLIVIVEIIVGVIVSCMLVLVVIWRKIRIFLSIKVLLGVRVMMGRLFGRLFGVMIFMEYRFQLDGDDSYV